VQAFVVGLMTDVDEDESTAANREQLKGEKVRVTKVELRDSEEVEKRVEAVKAP
jgi:hypothetical protein